MYEHTTRPLVDYVLDGYNATVFAYGVRHARCVPRPPGARKVAAHAGHGPPDPQTHTTQATGAGKTHTMLGYTNDAGVMVLTMKELFQCIEQHRATREIKVRLFCVKPP